MNPTNLLLAPIITRVMRKVPAKVRFVLLATFVAAVGISAVLQIVEVDLPYDKINQVLVLLGGYLGIQSMPNVPLKEDERDGVAA